ncbi:MAG: pilin [Patescibacteria group bacterium]|nr:pilin [Patescibacteria group bacterium]
MFKKIIVFLFFLLICNTGFVLADYDCQCVSGSGGTVSKCSPDCQNACASKGTMKDCKEKVDSGASAKLENPLKGVTSVQQFIGLIIRAALGIVGSLALLMVIYGGFLLMTAHGNEQQVTKGKDVLIWAVLGLIIIFTSYAVVKNILDILK